MKPILKNISKHKNNKFFYYSLNFARQFVPKAYFQAKLDIKLSALKEENIAYILDRVNYYNKLEDFHFLPQETKTLSEFRLKKKLKTYFFDTFEYTRYFSDRLKIDYSFGDITTTPPVPSIVKSRPINGNNDFGVTLNLDKIRHFTFTKDKKKFKQKKDMLVGRMAVHQAHRLQFLEMYSEHYMCNVGQVNEKGGNKHFLKEYMSIDEQLDYKYILCLEGNDVSSALKWVMSSNSVAVMPRPKFETWFMEGRLIPNVHYIEIKDDYSDLEEKLKFYNKHPKHAELITKNAHNYIKQFKNKKQENLISLLVLEKYCFFTGQKELNKHCRGFFASGKSVAEVARLIV